MRVRHLLLASMMLLGLLTVPTSSHAMPLAIEIDVFKNGVFLATATKGGGVLTVQANTGDHLRFLVRLDDVATIKSYNTTIVADDPNEMVYIVGSGEDFSGLNFAGFGDPDSQLNDGTPGVGNVVSDVGLVTTMDLYLVEYFVTDVNSDGFVDFAVTATVVLADDTVVDPDLNVQINATPEPATLLLLGSGLAGLAGFSRRRKRR